MNPTSKSTLTSPVIIGANGRDWTSEEAQARRELAAWLRDNGRRQEEPVVRELQVTEGGWLFHTAGDEQSFDLSEIALHNLGFEPKPERDWVEIDEFGSDMGIWGEPEDEDEYIDLLNATHTILHHPVVSLMELEFESLIHTNGQPYGEAELDIIQAAVQDANTLGVDWRKAADQNDNGLFGWALDNCQELEKAAEAARKAEHRAEAARKAAEERAAESARKAEHRAEAARKAAEERAAKAAAEAERRAEAGRKAAQKPARDWMGREVHTSGTLLFGCTGQAPKRYGRGTTPCPTRGTAQTMLVNGAYLHRQLGREVEVWDLHKGALCPTCAARIAQAAERKGLDAPGFWTIKDAVSKIEQEERELKGNNVLIRLEGMTESIRPSRCAVVVDWATSTAWQGLIGNCRGPADWQVLRMTLNLGSLDINALIKRAVPAWTVDGNPVYINLLVLMNLEREQRAWDLRQRERDARQRGRNARRQQDNTQAPWMY